jgi:hypothetical protein
MVERMILYIDVFLLTFAIGINVHRVEVWYPSAPEQHYCTG